MASADTYPPVEDMNTERLHCELRDSRHVNTTTLYVAHFQNI